MPAIFAVAWPFLLTLLQTLVSYLLGRGVFESLLLVGIRKYCKRWPNATVIELAIAWADSVGKRHLLGDLQVPPDGPAKLSARIDRGQGGFTTAAFLSMICIVGAALVIGYAAGVHKAQCKAVPVVAKPAKALPGGGLRLATEPVAKAKPAQPVEKGSKVMAVGQIKVKPKPIPEKGEAGKEGGPAKDGATDGLCECGEITIDYTQTIDKDGQPGMQVSPIGGQITGGHHSPLVGPVMPKALPWAVGVTHGLTGDSGDWGVAVDRDWSAVRGSVDMFQDGRDIGGRVGVLIKF